MIIFKEKDLKNVNLTQAETIELNKELMEKVNKYLSDIEDLDLNSVKSFPLMQVGYLLEDDTYINKQDIDDNVIFLKELNSLNYITHTGFVMDKKSNNFKRGYDNTFGYRIWNITTAEGKNTTCTINNIVYRKFIENNIEKGFEIDHIDSNKHNNHILNLQKISKRENLKKRGQFKKFSSNYLYDRTNNTLYKNRKALADELGASCRSAITKVLNKEWNSYKGHKFYQLSDQQMQDVKEYEKANSFKFFNKSRKKYNISQLTL